MAGGYRADAAHTRAQACTVTPRVARHLQRGTVLWEHVMRDLKMGYSPEQMAGRLRHAYLDDMRQHLSAETLYGRAVCAAARRSADRTVGGAASGAQGASPSGAGNGSTGPDPHMTPIAARPAEVVPRTVPGHWEGDLIKGARNGLAVGTLVERTTRLVLLARMDGTDATSARQGFTQTLRHVPALLRKTLTYDRGKEMAEHKPLAQRLAIQIFFADPYRPWQRGTNENTNGLLRQYLPKGTDWRGTRNVS